MAAPARPNPRCDGAVEPRGRAVLGRRGWRAVTLAWWASILLLIPFGRSLVDALRSRGLLAVGVTVGFTALFVAAVAVVRRLRQRRIVTPRSAVVALLLIGVVTGLAQLLPRAEERWHVAQYAVLGALLWPAVGGAVSRRLPWAAVLVLGAGWLDEGIQYFLPERVYDLWDVGLNAGAGWAGMAVVALVEVVRSGSRQSQEAQT